MLRQDVGFFDTDASTGDIVFGVSTDTLLVLDAVGEKVGNFIHYIATFLAGLVIGFIAAWRLALLSVAVIPAIAFAGGLYAMSWPALEEVRQKVAAKPAAGNAGGGDPTWPHPSSPRPSSPMSTRANMDL